MPEVKYSLSNEEKKYFMCNKCFKVIQGNYNSSISFFAKEIAGISSLRIFNDTENHVSIECPYCNDEDADMFEIDEYMINPIKALNEKGYYTKFCCEGHVYSSYVQDVSGIYDAITDGTVDAVFPYIWFDWDKIVEEKQDHFHQMEITGFQQFDFKNAYYIDKPFFYYEFGRDFTLFKSDLLKEQIGLLNPPEGWIEEFNNHKTDAIYYKGKEIGVDEDSNIIYEVSELFDNLNKPEDDYGKRLSNTLKAMKAFSSNEKSRLFNYELMEWIKSLPDLKSIYTKSGLFKAFNL